MSDVVHGFTRTSSGRVILRVDVVEKGLLVNLLEQLIQFIEPDALRSDEDPLALLVGIDEQAERPEDPALARLFPDAYPDDEAASAEVRRYTERSLRDAKVTAARIALQTLRDSGEKLTLTVDQARAWIGALTDLRLALGTRLGISEDRLEEFASLPDEDPQAAAYHVYDWLTYLNETAVRCLLPD